MKGILAVGDCVALGTADCLGNSYPERIGRALDTQVSNRSKGMCTSREGKALLRDNLTNEFDCVILQFGLVDAYTTFKYAPYIPYYPDSMFRKTIRNIVKKFKKLCRKYGLHERFGEDNVISEAEYRANFQHLIRLCENRLVIIPETIPHLDTFRNPHIKRYNKALEDIALENEHCCFVRLFDNFLSSQSLFYLDKGHPNNTGYTHITDEVLRSLENQVN
jgi:lysophospholipase L1-like esterase